MNLDVNKFICIALFSFCINSLHAAEWFVRPPAGQYGLGNGTSYNNGWSGFKAIRWGSGGVKPGDRLYVCGTHGDTLNISISGLHGLPIVITGDCNGGNSGILQATDAGIRFDDVDYFIFENLEFRDSKYGMICYGGCNNIEVNNSRFTGMSLKGLHIYSPNPSDYAEYIVVRDSIFENIGDWGNTGANSITFAGYSRNTTVEDSVFTGDGEAKGVDGILVQNIAGDGSNHVIRRNIFKGHKENGIDLKHVIQSSQFEGTTKIYENDFSGSSELEIVMHWGTQGVDIYRNRFHDGNLAIGIVKHADVINSMGYVTVTYNLFYNFESAILLDNYSEGVGNNLFINNTVYSGATNSSQYPIQIKTNRWIIQNNIFSNRLNSKSPYSSIRFLSGVDMETVDSDYNLHDLPSGYLAYRMPDNTFQSAQQYENNGIQAAAGFVSAASGDFSLAESSKAIQAGRKIDLGELTRYDLNGNLVPDIPSIGAIEKKILAGKSAPTPPVLSVE